jgi:uncharacterized lipoprotein YddW (UPF0748 family)
MKKIFLLLLSSSLLIGQVKEEFRAVKLTNVDSNVLFSDANIADAMNFLASCGVNIVLPVVWNGGWTIYQSNVMDSLFGKSIHPSFYGRDPLERVIIEAHRNGIEVYPWFEYGFAAWYSGGTPPFGGHLLEKFPDWACKDKDGKITTENGFDWLSAINPDVQNFINSLVKETISKYDVDGIELSDRIPAMPVKGGYDDFTKQLYQSEHNGQLPPTNIYDSNWKRWRADKLNDWYRNIRSIIKNKGQHIFVSSSPSVYPWAYDNYLQDAKTWIDEDIADHFIPQLYRYDYQSYLYELNSAINLVGDKKEKLFPGILMNLGVGANEYVIPEEYLMNALKANRDRGINGEAFFYYEGFRKKNFLLADTLKATFYSEPAIVPLRGGSPFRPKAQIVNEEDAIKTGNWQSYSMKGFEGKILRVDNQSFADISYFFNINDEAFYDVFLYSTPNTTWTDSAHFLIYGLDKTEEIFFTQKNLTKQGWQKISTVRLKTGNQKILKADNSKLKSGQYLVADAVMLMINRQLSPDVVVSAENISVTSVPKDFALYQNYPNPFNPSTTIQYSVPSAMSSNGKADVIPSLSRDDIHVTLKVYDVLGREVATLVNENKPAGIYNVKCKMDNVSSGIYFYTLKAGVFYETKKMVLIK